MIDSLLRDLRFALRTLRQRPGFALLTVITLGLGIGANTTIFTLVNTSVLRPLRFPDSERLVVLWERQQAQGKEQERVAAQNFLDWREQTRAFRNLAAWTDWGLALTGTGEPEELLTMLLVSCFAVLALTLGAIGIYGVMIYFVSQRTREIGIRIALGALPREILRLVLSQGVWLATAGILAGLAGALATTRLLTNLLFEVRPDDPATYLLTALALALVALVATLVPALRATRVDPIDSLRSE